MAIINIIVWLLGISFIIMLFVIAYKAAIEDGSPGCLYALIAAAIIIIIYNLSSKLNIGTLSDFLI